MPIINMTDLDLAGKRVLIREDLNVPVKDGVVTSDARLRASLPTIELALQAGAAVMITSHLGRPQEGQYDSQFSLQPVVDWLAERLPNKVRLQKDWLQGVEVEAGTLAAICFARVSSLAFSPTLKRQFSKTIKVPASASTPCNQSFCNLTLLGKRSANKSTTGCRENWLSY